MLIKKPLRILLTGKVLGFNIREAYSQVIEFTKRMVKVEAEFKKSQPKFYKNLQRAIVPKINWNDELIDDIVWLVFEINNESTFCHCNFWSTGKIRKYYNNYNRTNYQIYG